MMNAVNGQDKYPDRVCQLLKTIISTYFDLPLSSYQSKSRVRQVIKLKQATVYFIRKLLPKATLLYIGKQMAYDHATVLHCIKKINELMETDVETREDIRKLNEMVQIKHDVLMLGGEVQKDYYFINLDKCASMRLPNGQAIVFSGMLPNQVASIRELLEKYYGLPLITRKHKGTGVFLLDRLSEDEVAQKDNTVNNGTTVMPTTYVNENTKIQANYGIKESNKTKEDDGKKSV